MAGARVTALSCGSSHSVLLLDCDCVVSFGKGEDGQLGHGDAETAERPRAIEALRGRGISAVACGAEYSIAVSRERRETYSWGWGDFGRLGHGTASDCFAPRPVAALVGVLVRGVACGDAHTLVVTDGGELFAFGRNQNGQLGVGTTEDVLSPQLVEGLSGSTVACAAAGAEHSVVSTADGRVFAFGWGKYGCLGDGTREDRHVPTPVLGLDGRTITAVACGWRHSIAVTAEAALITWGWGKFGQTGHGDTEDRLTAEEVAALRGARIARVSGGWRHTVAIDDGGACYAWGWGKFGQLGLGDTDDRLVPTLVTGPLSGRPAALVACGWRHTVVTTTDGGVWSWGRGSNCQLGHGDEDDRDSPAQISPGAIAAAAAAAGAGGAACGAGGGGGGGGAGGLGAADRFARVPVEAAGGGTAEGGGAAAAATNGAAASSVSPGGRGGGGAAAACAGGGGGRGGGGGGGGGGEAAAARKKARLDDSDAAVPGG